MFTGSVHASDRYICDRVVHPGAERERDRRRGGRDEQVEAGLPQVVEVALDQRPDLLRLEVERVVVAGRQRVRAEHDPALDLGAEAAAAGREVVGEVVVPAADAVAVADAVVAGEVGRRLGGRDDVVRREAVVGVREAHLLDRGAGRLELRRPPRGPAPRRPAPCPRRSTRSAGRSACRAATTPPRRPRRAAGRGRPAPGSGRSSSRARRGRRSRGGAPPRPASHGRTGRSGRGCWRTRRSRSATRGRTSASSRRSRTGPPAGGSSRRCRCRSRAGRGAPRRPPRSRPRSRRARASRSHGFAVGPNALCSVDEPIANSSMFVLPRITAPASRSRSVMCASNGER